MNFKNFILVLALSAIGLITTGCVSSAEVVPQVSVQALPAPASPVYNFPAEGYPKPSSPAPDGTPTMQIPCPRQGQIVMWKIDDPREVDYWAAFFSSDSPETGLARLLGGYQANLPQFLNPVQELLMACWFQA